MNGSLKYSQAEVLALTRQCIEVAMASGQHDLALTALLSAYATLADAHRCCTPACIQVLAKLSETLAGVSESRTAVRH